MQKHKMEDTVRNMFINHTYDIKKFDAMADQIQKTNTFGANSLKAESFNDPIYKQDLNSTAQNPVIFSSENGYHLSNDEPQPMVQDDYELDKAATKIQSLFRMRQAKKKIQEIRSSLEYNPRNTQQPVK